MSKKKFLVIRRDNIGDLVCTTPLIHALREHYPDARIDALVRSYNRVVLAGNSDLNHIYAYTTLRFREKDERVFDVLWQKIRLIRLFRQTRYDYIISIGGPDLSRVYAYASKKRKAEKRGDEGKRWTSRLSRLWNNITIGAHVYWSGLRGFWLERFCRPARIVAFVPPEENISYIQCPVVFDDVPRHEVEGVLRLLGPLGIGVSRPALRVYVMEDESRNAWRSLGVHSEGVRECAIIALHISAREIPRSWSAESFTALMRALYAKWNCRFLLLWSPGAVSAPLYARHPGDDDKAEKIIASTQDMPVLAYPTRDLGALIGALSVCDVLICSDGGAMHLAAGLQKPIVCFFSDACVKRWHPYGVEYELLQSASHNIADILVEDALAAFEKLNARLPNPVGRRSC